MENKTRDGEWVHSFNYVAGEGVRHFQNLFMEKRGRLIQEILDVLSKIPSMFTEEMNLVPEEIVSEQEVLVALSLMQKGKSHGPDGFTVEFFIGFYELLKEDVLMVVRESQNLGKILKCSMTTIPYRVATLSIN